MKRSTLAVAAMLLAVSLAACGKSSNVSSESAGPSAASQAAAAGGTVVAKAGTVYDGKLDKEISSKTSHNGDTFTLTAKGATIEGHVAGISAAGIGKKPAMTIVFDDIKMLDGSTAPINAQLVNMGAFDAKSHHMRTAGMMIAGAMAGHAAAHAAGRSHGGMMGAIGGFALSQEIKTDIDVKPGTILEVKLLSDASAPAKP